MDHLKEAFKKVKQDILFLENEINSLKLIINGENEKIDKLHENIEKINKNIQKFSLINSTYNSFSSTDSIYSSTDNLPLKPLKPQNIPFSTGNKGVSTDRQTDRQTDRHVQNILKKQENSIKDISTILDSLDNIKKEIRLKFKGITEQEFLVFSMIYQLDEEIGSSNYKLLSQKLKLTESSIRDYVGRLIKKGIPIEKNKVNNKFIKLSISKNLKKIASLSTILQLREL